MKKLSISILAIILAFNVSILFTSCENSEKDADEAAAEMTEEANEATEETAAEENAVADYSAGEAIYKSKCMACHQENGEGLEPSFPALKGKTVNLDMVVNGKEGTAMTAFKNQLSDQEIVDVVNYVDHAWGNNADDITLEDVAAVKK